MSLINQMLRDLENRKEPEQASSDGIHVVNRQRTSMRGWLRTLLAMLLTAAVVAAIFWYFGGWRTTPASVAHVKNSEVVHPAKVSAHVTPPITHSVPASPTAVPPAKLVKAVFSPRRQGGDKLTLSFDRSVDYQLHSPSDGSHVMLDVADTSIPGKPLFPGSLPAGISAVHVSRHGEGIRLDIAIAHAITAAVVPEESSGGKTVVIAFGTEHPSVPKVAVSKTSTHARPVNPSHVAKSAVSKPHAMTVNDASAAGGDVVKTPRKQTPAQISQSAYKRGLASANAGNLAEAEVNFRSALAHNPDNASARQALAALLLRSGRAADAERVYAAGASQGSHKILFTELDARLLANQGKKSEAIAVLKSLSPPINTQPAYYAMLAALQQQQKNYAAAESLYQRLVVVRPDMGIWWMGLGLSREHLNKPHAALDAYRHALSTGTLTGTVAEFVQQRIAALGN